MYDGIIKDLIFLNSVYNHSLETLEKQIEDAYQRDLKNICKKNTFTKDTLNKNMSNSLLVLVDLKNKLSNIKNIEKMVINY